MRLHKYRYTHREDYFRRRYPQLQTIKQWLHDLWECKNRGQKGGEEEGEQEPEKEGSEAESDEADWSTDDDEAEWDDRLRDPAPADQQPESPDEDLEWGPHDDIRLA